MPHPLSDSPVETEQVAQPTEYPSTSHPDSPLEQLAHRLAAEHQDLQPAKARGRPYVLERQDEQAALLQQIYQVFAHASHKELGYTYAAEWVLDNYYVVQQALRQVAADLPPNFYQELPRLAGQGIYQGWPRLYALVREYVLYENCQLDMERFSRFVVAYQHDRPLQMGELWALPIMLRFTITESLAQAAGREARLLSHDDIARLPPALRFQDGAELPDVVGNCIISLRLLDSQDWLEFVESMSRVDQILRRDPAGLYARMDFTTRDNYRKVVEQIAQYSPYDEVEVAELVIQLAEAAVARPGANGRTLRQDDADVWQGIDQPHTFHVGHYLLGTGRPELERRATYRSPAGERLSRWLLDHPALVYLGSISLLTLLLLVALLAYAQTAGASPFMLLLVALLGLIPLSSVSLSLVNWLVTLLLEPRVLPKLDFSDGVPARRRTVVVVPSLLTGRGEADSLLRQLEQHYLRNPDPHLGFALLTDFADAGEEETPADQELLEHLRQGLIALNKHYDTHPFYLFHRRRLWNPQEGVWMGWERKRGKLHEFNRLLRGDSQNSFMVQEGDLTQLAHVHYVITLDADTLLPRGEAARLVGTLAHPLNQARFDERGRVVEGYTVLQPRTEIMPTSANQSLFTRVFGGDVGLDLYTLAVSDVYQDLFGEGNYVGKGIYDVDAFERSLAGRVPENALLSHDLFEGLHGRAALVTDVVLYEEYPPHYLIHVRRSHRWIRGDWQLLPWLLPWVPGATGRRRNPLALIDLWKIADNLRRSLEAPALFAWFVAGWTILPGSPLFWTVLGLLMPAVSLIISTLIGVVRGVGGATWTEIYRPIRDSAIRWLLHIAFIPFETLLILDAILTTLWRLLVTRRRMLQWTTAAHTARLIGTEVSAEATLLQMLPSIGLVVLVGVLVVLIEPQSLLVAFPVMIAWVLAAELAHRVSRPEVSQPIPLTAEALQQLHALARRTWFFFEEFVGPDDNWLPPDHYQEWPRGVVAHRTSPTNTGLYLLSALAAYDLGYMGLMNLALRLTSTFDTLDRLDRHRGHFLNWIDTNTLVPLPPSYVSTVDSGNLAACLIVIKQACLDIVQAPVFRRQRWLGFLDTLTLLEEAVVPIASSAPQANAVREQITEIRAAVLASHDQPQTWGGLVEDIAEGLRPELERRLITLIDARSDALSAGTLHRLRMYLERVNANFEGIGRLLRLLLPWLTMLDEVPAYLTAPDTPAGLREGWAQLRDQLLTIPTLQELPDFCADTRAALHELAGQLSPAGEEAEQVHHWLISFEASMGAACVTASETLTSFQDLARRADEFVTAMDFGFLYNRHRQVFHIGYNLDADRLDNNYYDLLASEARIGSVIAIAKGDVPQSHWLHLARPLTRVENQLALLSWSGTMFEYLMPPLVMRNYRGTLLEQSNAAAIARQIAYGREKNVPWGISESGFYTFDNAQNYQYQAFGVPGLGFKRGLADDLVVAPYASLLALPVQPDRVVQNMAALTETGLMGLYGFYEAIDYTESRLDFGQESAIVRSYMAHHQGMIMLSLLNYLQGDKMVNRFHAEPRIQSLELLLQEQVPVRPNLSEPPREDDGDLALASTLPTGPWSVPVDTPSPQLHFLSNGRFSTLITNAGGGYIRGPEEAYTRWRPDTTLDNWGTWIYVQDLERDALWSAGLQPTVTRPDSYEVQFFPHMAQFRRRDHDITLQLEVAIVTEHPVEMRRLQLTNQRDTEAHLRLTSYGEVVLTDQNTDWRHQAFAKLFIESEYVPEYNALFFRRRPRKADEEPRFLAHMLLPAGDREPTGAYESDRARFLGRGHDAAWPAALQDKAWLSGTTGATLDPVMALGQDLVLEPHSSAEFAFLTFAAGSRAELLELAGRYARWQTIERAFASARARSEQELRQLDLPTPALETTQKLLSALGYPHAALRAPTRILANNSRGQPSLWAYGISGDYPILLVRLTGEGQAALLQDALRAHIYWRRRGLRVDLVIVNQEETNYGQALHGQIHRLIGHMESGHWLNRRGGLFVLREDQMAPEDFVLLQTAARVILNGEAGTLAEQIGHIFDYPPPLPELTTTLLPADIDEETPPLPRPEGLRFDNGWGGFSPDGKEYVVYLEPGRATPAPWINVIANPDFGFLVSEGGGGFTWAGNSGENRLTAWRNDPVTDMPAEALYLRDEETGEVWSPTPQPAPAADPYLVRHGAGYTIFQHHSHRLKQQVRLFVSPDDPVKIVQLRLENTSTRPRRITATFYAEWVLGTDRPTTMPYIIPWYRAEYSALLARNPYNVEFSEGVAFLAANREPHGVTADRTEFLGRLGSLRRPAALSRVGLNSRVQAGLDSCGAVQLHVDLPPGGSEEIYFLLGQAEGEAAVEQLLERFRDPQNVAAAWEATHLLWSDILGSVQVNTPDPAMDLLLNRWLLYQSLACRIWGRSALYQSSGAYGFRDQLQDVMSVVHSRPELAREHLLRSARHQFTAGDVLHWWHPPTGRGVRTRITDDLLWLPFVTTHYIRATGDRSVLDDKVPFLVARPLASEEEQRYGHYESSEESYSLYDHCCRALERGATKGPHGLPLIGGGDWNDGMDRVGIEGHGESVWLAWFLYDTLNGFAALCDERDDAERAAQFRRQAEAYRQAAEQHAWDGAWYRRAYYDDGTPLGSHLNEECQIDSLAQSWAVLTGAARPERAAQAMASAFERLVREDEQLILLFTPPFDRTNKDPGYIKGYVPGIRENGGQYTHAALWLIWAFAEMGEGERAEALFRLINPIYRADTAEKAAEYKVEPYVIAADVYGVAPHEGRGGWTWYTGSGGWMYQLGLEGLLGLRREGQTLRLEPHIPTIWPGFRLRYRYGQSIYHIEVRNPAGVSSGVREVQVDGRQAAGGVIHLQDDGQEHQVIVELGPAGK